MTQIIRQIRPHGVLFMLMMATSCILAQYETEEETIYGINSRIMPRHGYSWLSRDILLPKEDLNVVTVCLFFMLQYQDWDPALFLEVDPPIYLIVEDNHFLLRQEESVLKSNVTLRYWRWTHVCIILGSDPAIFLDGIRTTTREPTSNFFEGQEPLVFRVGKSPPNSTSFAGPFSGLVTQPQVFLKALDAREISLLTSCSKSEVEGEVQGEARYEGCHLLGQDCHPSECYRTNSGILNEPDTEDSSEEDHHQDSEDGLVSKDCPSGPNRHYDSSDIDWYDFSESPTCTGKRPHREICGPFLPKNYFMHHHNKKFGYGEALIECSQYGAQLAEYIERKPLSITNSQPWVKAKEPGVCQWIKDDHITNTSCSEKSFNVLCQMEWDQFFELRWQPRDEPILLQLVSDDSSIYFVSRDNEIRLDPTKIRIGDDIYVAAEGVHVGRMEIRSQKDPSTNITITLSACSNNEFTCNDGRCIPLELRCNGVNDCLSEYDDSDETHCDNFHKLPMSYNKDRPPLVRTPLCITVKMMRVHDISVEEGLTEIWMKTITKWKDNRLKFTHLSDIARDNIIKTPERIWLPEYILPNALFRDAQSYSSHQNVRTTLFIHRLGDGEFDIHDGYEDYEYYGGRDAELQKDDDFLIRYLCEFELDFFPFDCHECYIEFVIKNHGSFMAYFDKDKLKVESVDSPTNLFYVSELKLCSIKNETYVTRIVMKFLVTRKFGASILTTFLPSMILGIIGCFTHTFDQDDFSDRIMVTLTCLIVIASLFSSTTSATPNSASPKLVDIFFFFYIARLFMIFIIHSIQGLLYKFKKNQKGKTVSEKDIESMISTLVFKEKLPPSYARSKDHKELTHEVKIPLKGAWEDDFPSCPNEYEKPKQKGPNNLDQAGLILGLTIDVGFLCYFIISTLYKRHSLINQFSSDSENCPITGL